MTGLPPLRVRLCPPVSACVCACVRVCARVRLCVRVSARVRLSPNSALGGFSAPLRWGLAPAPLRAMCARLGEQFRYLAGYQRL